MSTVVSRSIAPVTAPRAQALLEVRSLSVEFRTELGPIRPVSDVTFSIHAGQTVALVGESGCGKSVTAMSILRLVPSPPGKIVSGEILFEGADILKMRDRDLRRVRGGRIAMIFQEPMTSLNPVYTVGNQIVEAIKLHQGESGSALWDIASESLRAVGIADVTRRLSEYPHQLSGGMRQRVMIAMALACKPDLLIADEPTTALDVTIQAQILELLRDLQQKRKMAVLLITHDLGVVAENADVVHVMYASHIVESAPVRELFRRPQHPYTEGLLRSIPRMGQSMNRLQTIAGTVPLPSEFPKGCKFHPRCPRMQGDQRCLERQPPLRQPAPGHAVACVREPGYETALEAQVHPSVVRTDRAVTVVKQEETQ